MGRTLQQILTLIGQNITDPLLRQNTAKRTRQVMEAFATDYFNKQSDSLQINQVAGLADALDAAGANYTVINADVASNIPDTSLNSQNQYNSWILGYLRLLSGNITTPAKPQNPQTDDIGDTFSVDLVPGYNTISDYQGFSPFTGGTVILTATNGYIQNGRVYLKVIGAAGIGEAGIGVAASGSRPAGPFTTNLLAFTGTPAPVGTKAVKPSFGAIDDVNNVVTLNSQYAYTEVRWGVEGQTAQPLAANSICSPGNIAGRLFAYVIADSASSRLQSETEYSGAFSLSATANNAPTVALSSPQAGQTLGVGDPVVLNAAPQDADGAQDLKRVEFLDNGVKFTETTVAPHTVQRNITAGSHNFTARVYDMVGATGLSNAVTVSTVSGPFITLSEQGVVSDTDLSMHPAYFGIDQTAKVQAAIDLAEAQGKNLYFNCAVTTKSIYTGSSIKIYGPSDQSCGAVLLPGENTHLLLNKHPIAKLGGLPVTNDHDAQFQNLIFNGAGYNADGSTNRRLYTDDRGWCHLIDMCGVKNYNFDNCIFRNCISIMALIANYENVTFTNFLFEQSPSIKDFSLRLDGPKFMGPAVGTYLTNGIIKNRADDSNSYDCTDIWFLNPSGPDFAGNSLKNIYACGGPMSTIHETNVQTFYGVINKHGKRFLSNGYRYDDVIIDNCGGQVDEYVATFDGYIPDECYRDKTLGDLPVFGSFTWKNSRIDFKQNRAAGYYFQLIDPNGLSGLAGAGFILKARFDSFNLVDMSFSNSFSADYPLFYLDPAGSIGAMYGNNVKVDGVADADVIKLFNFKGSMGQTSGNLFTPGVAIGAVRAVPSNAARKPTTFGETLLVDFEANPNCTVYLTDGGGVPNLVYPYFKNAKAGLTSVLRVINTGTVAKFFEVKYMDNQPIQGGKTNRIFTIPANGGRLDLQSDCTTQVINHWVDEDATTPLGIIAPPAGWKGAIAEVLVPDELVNTNYLVYEGDWQFNSQNPQNLTFGSNKYLRPGVDGVVRAYGFGSKVAFRATTATDQFSGPFRMLVSVNGAAFVEYAATQYQVNPDGSGNSWNCWVSPDFGANAVLVVEGRPDLVNGQYFNFDGMEFFKA